MSQSEIYSSEKLLELSGGDVDFVIELLEAYVLQAGQEIDAVKKMEGEKDWDGVKFIAHRLRSSSGSVGAKRIAKACSELENYIASSDDIEKSVYLYVESFLEAVSSQLAEIEQELNEIRKTRN
jgi:HPt (histidine-containing phosphotransfer) domain-containing protein